MAPPSGGPTRRATPPLRSTATRRQSTTGESAERWPLRTGGKLTLRVAAFPPRSTPRGDDCWLGCGPGDGEPGRLAAGLATALDAVPSRLLDAAGDDVARMAAALGHEVWARSPRQVCLMLDDVHEIARDSGSARLLDALVDALPANGHLVVSGRQEPPLRLARPTSSSP